MSRALTLSTSASATSWDDAYEDLAFSAYALATQIDDPALAPLYGEVQGALADWERIEADRRAARGAAIAARAHVRVADAALDLALSKIAGALLAHTDGAREHALYQRLFPVAHERVIALGLDAELPGAGLVMAQLDDDAASELPEAVRAHATALRQCLAIGNAALMARADAYAHLGRLEARVEAWLETADAIGGQLAADLTRLGEERGLDSRWSKSFFPA